MGMGVLDEAAGPPSVGAELMLPAPFLVHLTASITLRACPECRITSSYYIPHKYWISDVGEKEKLIRTFKARTG